MTVRHLTHKARRLEERLQHRSPQERFIRLMLDIVKDCSFLPYLYVSHQCYVLVALIQDLQDHTDAFPIGVIIVVLILIILRSTVHHQATQVYVGPSAAT